MLVSEWRIGGGPGSFRSYAAGLGGSPICRYPGDFLGSALLLLHSRLGSRPSGRCDGTPLFSHKCLGRGFGAAFLGGLRVRDDSRGLLLVGDACFS